MDLRLWEQIHPSPDHACGSDPVPGSHLLHPPPLDKIPPKAIAPSALSLPTTSWVMTRSVFLKKLMSMHHNGYSPGDIDPAGS